MIQINSIEYSKNPVTTGEALLISVSLTEVNATWTDVKAKTWSELVSATWDKIKRKIF